MNTVFVLPKHQEMLDDWLRFEHIMGPQDPKKSRLTKKARPQPVADWLDRQPGFHVAPPIGTPLEYGTSWCTWWRSMQPRWRREGDKLGDVQLSRCEMVDEAWVNVAKAGCNGIFLVLVSLSWWLVAAKEDSDRCWCLEAIDDVGWVLKQLVRRFANVVEEEADALEDEGAQRGKKRYPIIYFINMRF